MAGTKFPTPLLLPRDISTCGIDECLPIVLTSEIGHGATGIVHGGTLQLESAEGSVPLDIVVKLAFDNQQRHALRDEYEVYCNLRSKGVLRGITTVLGFFDDCEGGPCALVMLYAGASLATEPERVLPVSDWWVSGHNLFNLNTECFFSNSKSALLTLESIHRAGVLHGDIRPENILVSDARTMYGLQCQ